MSLPNFMKFRHCLKVQDIEKPKCRGRIYLPEVHYELTPQSWLWGANFNPQCRVGYIYLCGMHPTKVTKLSVQESFVCPG